MTGRRLLFIGISLAFVAMLVLVATGLHALVGKSGADTWSAPLQAASTLALVAITAWYAYTTHAAPRRASQETMLREVSRYIARHRQAIWTAQEFFPIPEPPDELPEMMALFDSRDALRAIRDRTLEFMGLLPRKEARLAAVVTLNALEAENELHALGAAILDETQAGHAEGRTEITWEGIRNAHLAASEDSNRREPWGDLLTGKYVTATAKALDELSEAIDRELTG